MRGRKPASAARDDRVSGRDALLAQPMRRPLPTMVRRRILAVSARNEPWRGETVGRRLAALARSKEWGRRATRHPVVQREGAVRHAREAMVPELVRRESFGGRSTARLKNQTAAADAVGGEHVDHYGNP